MRVLNETWRLDTTVWTSAASEQTRAEQLRSFCTCWLPVWSRLDIPPSPGLSVWFTGLTVLNNHGSFHYLPCCSTSLSSFLFYSWLFLWRSVTHRIFFVSLFVNGSVCLYVREWAVFTVGFSVPPEWTAAKPAPLWFSFFDQKCNTRRHLTDNEVLALIVGCLCHDLDHRGTNNAFQHKWAGLTKHVTWSRDVSPYSLSRDNSNINHHVCTYLNLCLWPLWTVGHLVEYPLCY